MLSNTRNRSARETTIADDGVTVRTHQDFAEKYRHGPQKCSGTKLLLIYRGMYHSLLEEASSCSNTTQQRKKWSKVKPTEHAFHLLKRGLKKQKNKPPRIKSNEETEALVMSVNPRLDALIANKEFATKYYVLT